MTFIQGLCDEHLSKKDLSDILTEDLFLMRKFTGILLAAISGKIGFYFYTLQDV